MAEEEEWELRYEERNLTPLVVGIVLTALIVAGAWLAIWSYQRHVNKSPVIDSVIMPLGGGAFVGTPTTLGIGASDPDGDVLSYKWTCEEDPFINSRTENVFEWTPTMPGTYYIQVTISDGVNEPVTRSMLIIVSITQAPPQAEISAPATVKAGREAIFSGAGSTDPDGNIISYTWNFGDGTTGSGSEVIHTYTNPGRYVVSLTVVDNSGLTDNAAVEVTVLESPAPPYDVEAYFIPSGWMGDFGDIGLNTAWTTTPRTEPTCIKIVYTPAGANGWAGIYWQSQDQNWGDYPGHDLSGATKLTFWARGESGGEKAEFKVGGIKTTGKPYSDSIYPPVTTGVLVLTNTWQQYTINLAGKDMSNIIGGFCWVTNKPSNPGGCTVYLDNIVFEA